MDHSVHFPEQVTEENIQQLMGILMDKNFQGNIEVIIDGTDKTQIKGIKQILEDSMIISDIDEYDDHMIINFKKKWPEIKCTSKFRCESNICRCIFYS